MSEAPQPLSKYGRMRRRYLQAQRPILFHSLVVTGELHPHLLEIEQAARSRLEQMLPELMAAQGATERLKASDPMAWTGLMNNLKAQAEETILTELVHS